MISENNYFDFNDLPSEEQQKNSRSFQTYLNYLRTLSTHLQKEDYGKRQIKEMSLSKEFKALNCNFSQKKEIQIH